MGRCKKTHSSVPASTVHIEQPVFAGAGNIESIVAVGFVVGIATVVPCTAVCWSRTPLPPPALE